MTPNSSRMKGRNFEKKICKVLGLWWCDDPQSLYCNISSGGRSTVIGHVYSGDVIPVKDCASPWTLSVELKKSENWSFDGFLNNNPSEPLFSYIGQCYRSARSSENNIPILICAKNHKKPLVFFDIKNISNTQIKRVRQYHNNYFVMYINKVPDVIENKFNLQKVSLLVTQLDIFLRIFTRNDFVKYI